MFKSNLKRFYAMYKKSISVSVSQYYFRHLLSSRGLVVIQTIHILYPIATEETKQYIGNSRLGRDFGISVMLCVNCLNVSNTETKIALGWVVWCHIFPARDEYISWPNSYQLTCQRNMWSVNLSHISNAWDFTICVKSWHTK